MTTVAVSAQVGGCPAGDAGQPDGAHGGPWTSAAFDDLIAALLRGESRIEVARLASADIDHFVDRGWFHNVLPLLFEKLAHCRTAPALVARLRQESLGQGMWELRHQIVLQTLAQSLKSADVEAICFKGSALAYDIYPKPYLRTRCDSDLLVQSSDLETCRQCLTSLGFVRGTALPGEWVSNEEAWTLRHQDGSQHTIDLHWQINNARRLAQVLSWQEMRSSARPLAAVGGLLVPDRAIALLIACMHRGVHRDEIKVSTNGRSHGGERLFWLYDVHLLTQQLGSQEWQQFCVLAQAKGLAATAGETLALSRSYLRSVIPQPVVEVLARSGHRGSADRYLTATRRRREFLNILAIEDVRGKIQCTQEILLPPKSYLLRKYPHARVTWAPWLHVRRWTEGSLKRLKPRKACP